MAFTKLGPRLRAHDWFGAAIELLIVVVGILIALQVDNWNQARHDRARADDYLRRLHSSLASDLTVIDNTQAFWSQVAGYGQKAMTYAETGQRVDGSNWKTLLAFYHASQLMPLELADTTYVEMRDNADLGLIRDESLRSRVSNYYQITTGNTMRANLHRHDPEYRRQIRGLTPWAVQEYIWSHCYRQLDGTRQQLLDCPAPISEEQADAVLQTYRRSDTLMTNLRFWMSALRVSGIVMGETRASAQVLARDVAAAR